MSDVIKRGRLEVKKRNLFGSAYKNRCVVLRNSLALNCKTVEILDGEEESEECKDVIRLNEAWSVQDKPSKNRGRYTFELVKGDEVILTFACASKVERDDWNESFRILNQLALPCETGQQLGKPATDYFQVTLLKNRHAVEINHSGSYLLSITEAAIVLHWKTGAIAHHWPKRSVVKFLHHPKREGHLILHAKKSGTNDVVDFEFTTNPLETSMQILKAWNIRLMESISFNPQQLNEISSVLNTSSTMPKQPKGRGPVSRSFRATKHNSVSDQQDLRRADSFSKINSYRTNVGGAAGAMPGGLSQGSVRMGGLPPLPQEAIRKSWGGDDSSGLNGMPGALSQDSIFTHPAGLLTTPPPLPPRPNFRGSNFGAHDDNDDPDYAYIKEEEVEGPASADASDATKSATKRPSISVDDALYRLELDIMRENARKKEEEQRRRVMTLDRPSRSHISPLTLGPRVHFPPAQPQDYMDFVPSKRTSLKSTSSEPDKSTVTTIHTRSTSEPQPAVFEISDEQMDSLEPDIEPTDYSDFMPASAPSLPPRSWRNTSASSNTSMGSSIMGTDLSESLSNTVFAPAGEVGVAANPQSASPVSDTVNEPDKLVSLDSRIKKITPPHSSDKAPPTTIPEEPASSPQEDQSQEGTTTTPPPLPPRSPTKEKLIRKSSTSSNSSSSSSSGRCPRCRSIRKSKAGKTVSLDQHSAGSAAGPHDDCRKSMPDLANAKTVPENSLGGKGHHHGHKHTHCSKCSPASSKDTLHGDHTPSPLQSTSLQNFDYLQLVEDSSKATSHSASSLDNELGKEMDLLNSCLQTLEYLENKVKASSSGDSTSTMTSVVSNSTLNHTPTASHWAAMTTHSKVKTPPSSDVKQSVYTQAKSQAEIVLAELNQPLSTKPSGHTPQKSVPNGHPNHLHKQTSLSSFPTTTGARGTPNGTHPLRSTSSTALTLPTSSHAPPVPPRSMVSLTDTLAMDPNPAPHNRTSSKLQSHSASHLHSQTPPTLHRGYNRSVSGSNMGVASTRHHQPVRSASSLSTFAPPTNSSIRSHSSLQRHEPSGQSKTVFIQHIKDRRVGGLTHLV